MSALLWRVTQISLAYHPIKIFNEPRCWFAFHSWQQNRVDGFTGCSKLEVNFLPCNYNEQSLELSMYIIISHWSPDGCYTQHPDFLRSSIYDKMDRILICMLHFMISYFACRNSMTVFHRDTKDCKHSYQVYENIKIY